MDRIADAYRIAYPLNIKVAEGKTDEVKRALMDLLRAHDELEPYFYTTIIWEQRIDAETNKEQWKCTRVSGGWGISDLEKIKEIEGVEPDSVRVGKKPMTLEQALAEVDAAVKSAQEEIEHEASLVEQFGKAREIYSALYNYGYHRIYKLMNAQADLDRNSLLGEIADSLADISRSLGSISDCMQNRSVTRKTNEKKER